MAARVATREVSPLLQKWRQLLMGRDPKNALRFEQGVAVRPGPEANIAPGPANKVAANYYYTRDARREVGFPKTLADNSQQAGVKALAQGEVGEATGQAVVAPTPGATLGAKRPGKIYNYSL